LCSTGLLIHWCAKIGTPKPSHPALITVMPVTCEGRTFDGVVCVAPPFILTEADMPVRAAGVFVSEDHPA
jgi:hypothetical protein